MNDVLPIFLANLEGGADHLAVTFHTGDTDHRHMTIDIRRGDFPAFDAAWDALATAAVAAGQEFMYRHLGGVNIPDDAGSLAPDWHCRICDATAPAASVGWIMVPASKDSGNQPGFDRHYCPEHVPQQTMP